MPDLSFIAAPMINQSDLPFRLLTRKYGATVAYTQMLHPEKLLNDQEYLEYHLRDLTLCTDDLSRPVVVQLCGNEPEIIVQAGRKLQNYCDGIDLNLGCPQETALTGHFGAYLLGQKDWPLVGEIVSAMSHSFSVPVSTKIRLCQPATKTLEFAERLEAHGASWITLHARHVSSRRRRQGSADLNQVRILAESDGLTVPIVSNGNVRVWGDLAENVKFTHADGIMVGEALLENPCLFANIIPDPIDISLEYIGLCRQYPGTATLPTIQAHIKNFFERECSRRPWFSKLVVRLQACSELDQIEELLQIEVPRWRGHPVASSEEDTTVLDDPELPNLSIQ